MPLKLELSAIKKNYVKLMKLPVSDLLPALKAVTVCVTYYMLSCHYLLSSRVSTVASIIFRGFFIR